MCGYSAGGYLWVKAAMTDDAELLRRYAEEKSEAAFAEVVQRHLDFVYASALRRVGGDTHLAQDVTQHVFVALARAAEPLAKRPVLAGWLYTTTRYAAAQVVRTERRRHASEQEAHLMNELTSAPAHDSEWERLRPVLDDTMDELDDRDREAVLLRFFEGRSFAEVGGKLQLTENAARMRVERALEKMGALLARRGVTSTAAALALALANQGVVAAPAGLGATVTGAALASNATAGGAMAGAKSLIFMSTTKIAAGFAAVLAALSIGVAVYQTSENRDTRVTLAAAERERDEVRLQLRKLQDQFQAVNARAQAAEDDNAKLLKAIQATAPARAAEVAAANAPITHDAVQARYDKAKALARSGNWEAALPEYLWCYDEGMVRVASFTGVRSSFLLGELEKMAADYPPAMAALRERRDRAEQRMLANTDRQAGADLAALNHTLGEDARNLETFDKLAADSPQRQGMLVRVYDQLIDARRYTDAAEARTYAQMSSTFDMAARERPEMANLPNQELLKQANRTYLLTTTTKNIEVLAGAGKLEQARALADKLLAYDGSNDTRAQIQEHAARAGHPDLLSAPSKP